jgi:hypothetical protein
MIAVGMSSAVRDMPTKLRCGLLDEGPDAIGFPRLASWYERREREVRDRLVRSSAAHQHRRVG